MTSKRYNGWGDPRVEAHLSESAGAMLSELVGAAQPGDSVSLEHLVGKVPGSRLPQHPLIDRGAEQRLRHARGQSLPDWVALRHGTINTFPDGVAFPVDEDQVTQLIRFAREHDAHLIPYGGGTSVVGHLTPLADRPVLTVSLARLNQVTAFDETNQLVGFGAGITGPDLESALLNRGYTLGHFPQSFQYSTLGGWVVTRSSGQQSLGFGRIEDQFAGGTLISPSGRLVMPPLPASAAGPDLRQLVLGSEGRMGLLTDVTVRVQRQPQEEAFHAVFFPSWERGLHAVRTLSQANLQLSMMRLSNPIETATNLALAGKERAVARLKTYLKLRSVGDEACMLLLGFSGSARQVGANRKAALSLCRSDGGVHLYQFLGRAWKKNRFRAPYLRNTLWDKGYAVDTLETCVTWDKVDRAVTTIEDRIRKAGEACGERVHVFTHLSHFYTSGCSIYTTYLFRLGPDPETTLQRWRAMKTAASNALMNVGGTISHQHGVGEDHRPYLHHEKSEMGLATLRTLFRQYDPDGMMNPEKLVSMGG